MVTPSGQPELRQKLAAIEHERWSDWQKYVHKTFYTVVDSNNVTHWCLPPKLIDGWERQIATPYANLSEAEQASDMEQVDRYWPLIEAYAAAAEQRATVRTVERLAAFFKQHHLYDQDAAMKLNVFIKQELAELEHSLRKEQE